MKSHLVALVAIISATELFQLSNGVLTSLIPIRLGLAEVNGFATSLVAAAYSVGFLLGCGWFGSSGPLVTFGPSRPLPGRRPLRH